MSCCGAWLRSALRVGDAPSAANATASAVMPNFAEERLVVGRRAEVLERRRSGRWSRRGRASPWAMPASTLTRALTDGRQHRVAVGLRPARRTTRGTASTRRGPRMPFSASWSRACDGELHLGAGADQDHVGGAALGVEQDVAAAATPVGGGRTPSLAARVRRHVLPGQAPGRRGCRCSPGSPSRPRRSRWRPPGGRRPGPGSRAGRRGARPAGGSGRPRRGRSSRGSRRR